MKKATTLFLAILMAVSLVGFGGCKKKAPAPGAVNAPAPATNAPSNAPAPSGGTNAPATNAPAS
ncbi:MAG: hypothetical protein M0Z61_00880 [Nitrospiraceae bacterium]|nr:hypothetical protein [Nitrospiraceae bacterium]